MLMDSLITTTTPEPPKILLYGQGGVGKSTLAAAAGAVLLDCENGVGNIPGLMRTPYLETWTDMLNWIDEMIASAGNGEAPPVLAIDTIDWMIRRLAEHVIIDLDPAAKGKKDTLCNSMGGAHGGFFKARDICVNYLSRLLIPKLARLTASGTVILLLAHADNRMITSPEGVSQRMAAPDLPDWAGSILMEWADAVLYARFGEQGHREIVTTTTNIVLAKNRYGLPSTLPLNWGELTNALTLSMAGGEITEAETSDLPPVESTEAATSADVPEPPPAEAQPAPEPPAPMPTPKSSGRRRLPADGDE